MLVCVTEPAYVLLHSRRVVLPGGRWLAISLGRTASYSNSAADDEMESPANRERTRSGLVAGLAA